MTERSLTHCVSSLCAVPARDAFAYLADVGRVGEWALGCWEARQVEGGLARGLSLFDGSTTFVRVVPSTGSSTVDFEVGVDPVRLERRISARVVAGDELGGDPGRSLVILTAWRTAAMDDERWRRLSVAHETEILILRERIERSAGG